MLDGVALVGIPQSWWLALMVLVVSVALGSYRHRHTLTLSEGDGRYVIPSAAMAVPMLALDEPPFHDLLFVLATVGGLVVSRTVGFAIVKMIRRRHPGRRSPRSRVRGRTRAPRGAPRADPRLRS